MSTFWLKLCQCYNERTFQRKTNKDIISRKIWTVIKNLKPSNHKILLIKDCISSNRKHNCCYNINVLFGKMCLLENSFTSLYLQWLASKFFFFNCIKNVTFEAYKVYFLYNFDTLINFWLLYNFISIKRDITNYSKVII